MLLLHSFAWSQLSSIEGMVKDQDGNAVPYATINVKGTKVSTAVNANGNFKIAAKKGDVLVISAINFLKTEFTIGDNNSVSIIMTKTGTNLSDVVVTTAVGVQRQARTLGYSTTKISNKELVQAKPVNVQNGLTGKVAGLQINTVNNGVFAPTRIVLRGNRSLTGNNQALVVVDGAIYYNDLSTLNPEDISDINILKGSSGSVLYGSEGSNGVIVITTKKGTKAAPILNFTTTTQFESVSYLPEFQNRFGSNGGEAPVDNPLSLASYQPYENQSYGPEYNGAIVPIGRPLADGSLYLTPYSARPDEKRNFFDIGITTQNNVSYSAGDDNSRYFISAQDVNVKGIMPKDVAHRNTVRLGGSRSFGKISSSFTAAYTYQTSNTTDDGNVYVNVVNTPAHIPLNSFKDWRNNPFASLDGYFNDYYENPWYSIDNDRIINRTHNLSGNGSLSWQATDWLSLRYTIATTFTTNEYEQKFGERKFSNYAKTNRTVIFPTDAGGLDTVDFGPRYISVDALASYGSNRYSNFLVTSDFYATFEKRLSKDLNLQFFVGSSYQNNRQTYSEIDAGGLFFPVYNISNRLGDAFVSQSQSQARKMGLFGDATFNYKSYLSLHGSYRTDIDSRLSKANRWISYYGVDAAFVLSDLLPALKDNHALDYAKIRVAYSVTGNASALGGGSPYISAGAYVINTKFVSGSGFPFGSEPGYVNSTLLPNPDIKPEIVTEKEIGFEYGVLNNRITGSVALYNAKTKDGIVFAQVSRASGFASNLVNAANTQNKGIEIESKFNVIKKRSLSITFGVNWSHNKNIVQNINGELTELQVGGSNGNAFAVVNQPYPVIKSRDWVRDSASGKVIVDPITGLPSRDPNLKILGNAVPVDIVGLTGSITWKQFSLSITADYRGGYKIFNSVGQFLDFTGVTSTTAATGRQHFVFPNSVVLKDGKYVDNTSTLTDDATYNFWPGLYNTVGYNYVVNAAAWKLREVVLSYEIPQSVLKGTHFIKKATFTVSGRNLLMIRPKSNVWTDPEFSEGTDNAVGRTSINQLPPTRIFGASLSINF